MKPFEKIKKMLDDNMIIYEFKEHEEVRTSEEAAKARGEDIRIGAKAMILKCDDRFIMFVLSAALKIDSSKVRILTRCKNLRFASSNEVLEETGCLPGGVPPFANIFNMDFFVDRSVFENEFMAFNAGEKTKSLKIRAIDYLNLMNPKIENFSKG